MAHVLAVSGAVGGIGCSTFAYALALQSRHPCLLIDGQPDGVPLDVLIGAEDVAGTRWSQVRVASDAILGTSIVAALPEWNSVHVLSADRLATADFRALPVIVEAMRRDGHDVVLDLPPHAAAPADRRILLLPPTLLGVAAAARRLDADTWCVISEASWTDFPSAHAERYLDAEQVGVVRRQRAVALAAAACAPPPAGTDLMRVAAQVWERVEHRA